MTEKALIELRGVSKYYMKGKNKVVVHENINLSIPNKAFVGLMGPSGCGKTTILNMIGGLDRCSSGSVIVGDNELQHMTENELAKWRARHVGFIFQFYNLMPVLTAYKNVELPLLLTDLNKQQRDEHVRTALDVVGLLNRKDHYPNELSGGQEQRVAIARAIVSDPTMLVCDEPTGDLDRKTADEIMQLLVTLNKEHDKTIIMVTHDHSVTKHCDYIINLEVDDLSNCHLKHQEPEMAV